MGCLCSHCQHYFTLIKCYKLPHGQNWMQAPFHFSLSNAVSQFKIHYDINILTLQSAGSFLFWFYHQLHRTRISTLLATSKILQILQLGYRYPDALCGGFGDVRKKINEQPTLTQNILGTQAIVAMIVVLNSYWSMGSFSFQHLVCMCHLL